MVCVQLRQLKAISSFFSSPLCKLHMLREWHYKTCRVGQTVTIFKSPLWPIADFLWIGNKLFLSYNSVNSGFITYHHIVWLNLTNSVDFLCELLSLTFISKNSSKYLFYFGTNCEEDIQKSISHFYVFFFPSQAHLSGTRWLHSLSKQHKNSKVPEIFCHS